MEDFEQEFNKLAGQAVEEVKEEESVEEDATEAVQENAPEAAPDAAHEVGKEVIEPASRPTIDDFLQFVPEDRRPDYAPLVEAAKSAIHRVASDDGRVAAMQRLYQEQRQRAEEYERRLKELESKQAQVQTAQQQAEVDAQADELAKDFPEVAKLVDIRLREALKSVQPPQKAAETVDVAEDLSSQYAALQAAHPDWQVVAKSREFVAWQQAQPPEVRRWIESDKAEHAIMALDRFKNDLYVSRMRQSLQMQEAKRKRLETNIEVRGAAAKPAAVPNDFEAAFNYYASK